MISTTINDRSCFNT